MKFILKTAMSCLIFNPMLGMAMDAPGPGVEELRAQTHAKDIKLFEAAPSIEAAIKTVIEHYPKYQLENFTKYVAPRALVTFKNLASKESDPYGAKYRLFAMIDEARPHSMGALTEGDGGELLAQLTEDLKHFIEVIFTEDATLLTQSGEKQEYVSHQVNKVALTLKALQDRQIDAVTYLKTFEGMYEDILQSTDKGDLYEFLTSILLNIPASDVTLEVAQAAEKFYFVVLAHESYVHFLSKMQKTEFLNLILNNFFMQLQGMPLQERVRLALPIILSNTDFAKGYLGNLLKMDLVEKKR